MLAGRLVDVNDTASLKVAEDAGPGDLECIGHAVEKDDVQVRIELQIRRGALHDDHCPALGTLARAGTGTKRARNPRRGA